jgi:glycosyltransferase involved in cell wall biosynthesis
MKLTPRNIVRVFQDPGILFRSHTITNIEGIEDFFVTRSEKHLRPGITALIRAKNESQIIQRCLESIAPVFEEIVFIDNASSDDTKSIALEFATRLPRRQHTKMRVFDYPFEVARCGPEHYATNADSVRSLVYYYNWSLAQVTTDYVVKWDADMVCAPENRKILRRELLHARKSRALLALPLKTAYISPSGKALCDPEEVNIEPRGFPNTTFNVFEKAQDWEVLRTHRKLPHFQAREVVAYEIKDTRLDEFSHWSSHDFQSDRKRKEWSNFNLVKRGDVSSQFVRIPALDRDGEATVSNTAGNIPSQ